MTARTKRLAKRLIAEDDLARKPPIPIKAPSSILPGPKFRYEHVDAYNEPPTHQFFDFENKQPDPRRRTDRLKNKDKT